MPQEITHHHMPGSDIRNKELLYRSLNMPIHTNYSYNFIFLRKSEIFWLASLWISYILAFNCTHMEEYYFENFIHCHPRDSRYLLCWMPSYIGFHFFLLSWFRPSCFSSFLRRDAGGVSFLKSFIQKIPYSTSLLV